MTSGPPAVILAGGKSVRMGFPKLKLSRNGVPVLRSMLETLAKTDWGAVAVVISDEELTEFLDQVVPGVKVIFNPQPELGMISSLRLALDWQPDEERGLLAWPVDHPLVGRKTLEALRAKADLDQIAVPVFEGLRGHPTWWGLAYWRDLRSLEAEEGARAVLWMEGVRVLEVETDDPMVLVNINDPAKAQRYNLKEFRT